MNKNIDLQMFAEDTAEPKINDAGITDETLKDMPQQNAGKTFTQEEIDKIIADRLKREREKYKDYEELKKNAAEYQKWKESQMTEAEKLQAKLAEYEKTLADKELEVATAKAEQIKAKVLAEMGMPLNLSERIFGTTEEEIRQDAEQLKQLLGIQGRPIGSGTNPTTGAGVKTFTRAQIQAMTPEEINANWDVISKILAEGKI